MAKAAAEIHFFSEGVRYTLRNKQLVSEWLVTLAKKHKRQISSLNYVFVSDKFLLKMNRDYLQHDTFTDIITFDLTDGKQKQLNGEIYISVDRVKENAEKFRTTQANEMHRVMAHGLLHLCGFGDKSVAQQKQMRTEEENALSLRRF